MLSCKKEDISAVTWRAWFQYMLLSGTVVAFVQHTGSCSPYIEVIFAVFYCLKSNHNHMPQLANNVSIGWFVGGGFIGTMQCCWCLYFSPGKCGQWCNNVYPVVAWEFFSRLWPESQLELVKIGLGPFILQEDYAHSCGNGPWPSPPIPNVTVETFDERNKQAVAFGCDKMGRLKWSIHPRGSLIIFRWEILDPFSSHWDFSSFYYSEFTECLRVSWGFLLFLSWSSNLKLLQCI